ncbi:MAG: ABC transporter ATP-binding protein [Desulfovibrionales bacterium]
MKAVTLERVSAGYGKGEVVRNVSFGVDQGELFVIIGPNGSGKTTLLRSVSGMPLSVQGDLQVLGRPLSRFKGRALARTVALVPQGLPEESPFTVLETVLMGRFAHQGLLGLQTGKDRETAEEAMETTRVSHLAGRRVDHLSGGEKQRVFIARALCQEPDIMLLDEPTASLDLAHQTRIMDLLEHLRSERGMTVIMVSHDLNLAAMYGDKLLLLSGGEVLSTGTPSEVMTFDTLEKAYGAVLLVDENPLGSFPRIIPVPGRYLKKGG